MSILARQGRAVKLHLAEAMRQAVAQSSNVTKRSVHQETRHHFLNMPSPPLPTPRLHPLPDPLAHALRVQLRHPPCSTARATPPPAPRPAASSPAGLYSASDRTPLGAHTEDEHSPSAPARDTKSQAVPRLPSAQTNSARDARDPPRLTPPFRAMLPARRSILPAPRLGGERVHGAMLADQRSAGLRGERHAPKRQRARQLRQVGRR